MTHGSRPKRRAPLRSTTPLARGAGLVRSGPLNPVSAKTAAREDDRVDCRMTVIQRQGGRCLTSSLSRWPCWGHLDVDELDSRGRGGSQYDPGNCVAVCRAAHDFKHQRPATATLLGLWGTEDQDRALAGMPWWEHLGTLIVAVDEFDRWMHRYQDPRRAGATFPFGPVSKLTAAVRIRNRLVDIGQPGDPWPDRPLLGR